MTDPYDRDGILALATERLLASVAKLTDDDVRQPSLLPGWTRGHVLAHVARNADAMRNLVTWARTGQETPDYASREDRETQIERDAPRPAAEHHRDIAESSTALAENLRALPKESLDVLVATHHGREFPAYQIAWLRFREVEIHHVDLDTGYASSSWPQPFVSRCLDDIVEMFAQRSDTPAMKLQGLDTQREWELGMASHVEPATESTAAATESTEPDAEPDTGTVTVASTERELLAWLLGRNAGEELAVQPAGSLPQPPAWR